MAKRRGKAKQRRRTKKKINLVGVTEALVLANVTTQGLFNTTLLEFVTGKTNHPSASHSAKYYWPSNTDNMITLPELLGFDQNKLQTTSQGQANPIWQPFTSMGAMTKVKENLKANGLMMGAQLVMIPVGFSVVNKLTAKPRRSANKLLEYTKLGVKV